MYLLIENLLQGNKTTLVYFKCDRETNVCLKIENNGQLLRYGIEYFGFR